MITQTEVDGVATLIAPTAGPTHAGLVFRVGRADETLARGGITHLIEHLALHRLGLTDYHFNGTTGAVVTHFHMQGSERDVAAFLTDVCAGLTDLPVQRLDVEKAILRTEASSRSTHVTEPLALWRHGARDHGLVSYPEWGLPMLTADDLLAWAARYFTRDNAVLWIAGERVPPGLSLRLPPGRREPVPAASCALPSTPAYFAGSASGAVALDAVVRRRSAATVFADVLERELFRALRQESGLSYTAGTNYEPRGDGFAIVTALADALPEKQDAVLGGFVDVLAKLRVGRIDAADVAAVVAKATEALAQPQVSAARLPGAAFNLLTGHPNQPLDALVADLRAVTVDDVHAVATEALGSALLMVPAGRRADWAGFAAAPTTSAAVVPGRSYPSLRRDAVRLVVGAQGASLVDGDGDAATVRFDECAAVLSWPDGGRLLVGHDAITLRVEPACYTDGRAALAVIDAAVPPQARVLMPERDPAEIPGPEPDTAPATGGGRPVRAGRRGDVVRAGVIGLVMALSAVLCLTMVALMVAEPADAARRLVLVVGTAMMSVYFAFAFVRSVRDLRR